MGFHKYFCAWKYVRLKEKTFSFFGVKELACQLQKTRKAIKMIISVINKKGGVGKTSFAFSIAKDLGLYLQSNDASVIESM